MHAHSKNKQNGFKICLGRGTGRGSEKWVVFP